MVNCFKIIGWTRNIKERMLRCHVYLSVDIPYCNLHLIIIKSSRVNEVNKNLKVIDDYYA